MTKIWKKKTDKEIKKRIFEALDKNINYDKGVLGVPASYLDEKVFNQDASFLEEAPYMMTMVKNPNHIGCHTMGHSESFFAGTQAIEKELIEICAVDILNGEAGQQDGYVASGGTEANIQAIWIYRNFFLKEMNCKQDEIAILCTEDSHYSMNKAANLLSLDIFRIEVQSHDRCFTHDTIKQKIQEANDKGKKYFIVISNMMTTMFGSVDDVTLLTNTLGELKCPYKLHIDGAYGGFYYPFTEQESQLTFENPNITSFTLDAHKMAQSPYGTGIFLIRKNYMHYANTQEASYVEGEDYTLIGSRSGANAVAVWMILTKNGPYGWFEKVYILQRRTEWLCENLEKLKIQYYRNAGSNIVTIKKEFVPTTIAKKYGLVPDSHTNPKWYKVVIMDHVSIEMLSSLIDGLKSEQVLIEPIG